LTHIIFVVKYESFHPEMTNLIIFVCPGSPGLITWDCKYLNKENKTGLFK